MDAIVEGCLAACLGSHSDADLQARGKDKGEENPALPC